MRAVQNIFSERSFYGFLQVFSVGGQDGSGGWGVNFCLGLVVLVWDKKSQKARLPHIPNGKSALTASSQKNSMSILMK